MRTPVLAAVDLSVGYGRGPGARSVLAKIVVELAAGELASLIGPNGTGKSTLLRSLAGFQRLLAGEVRVHGQTMTAMSARERAQHVAVVLTGAVAAGSMTAAEVVALGRFPHTRWDGRLRTHDREVVARSMAATGAETLADRALGELSDGERQRVMIARALAQEPTVLLLDEPGAYLDVRGRYELTALLLRLTRDHGLAVLTSTHDLEHALRHSDTVWLVDQQRLVAGAPEDLALSGAIDRTLGRGVMLDPRTGLVSAAVHRHAAVRVTGDSGR